MAEGEKTDEVVLKVDMHCEGCKARVRRSLAGFPGLEDLCIDMEAQKVTIKGKIDARKAYETVKRKSRRKTELLSPKLVCKHDCKKQDKKIEEKKEEEALVETTAVFKVKMHCGGCAKEVKKAIERMDRTWEVNVSLSEEKVGVKGRGLNPQKILDRVARKTGKTMEYLSPPPPPPPVKLAQIPITPTMQGKEAKKKAQKDEKLENPKPKDESKLPPAEEKKDMKKDDKKDESRKEDKKDEPRKDDKIADKKENEQDQKKVPEAAKEKKKVPDHMVEKPTKEFTKESAKEEKKPEEKREEKKEEKRVNIPTPTEKKAQNEKKAMEMEEMEEMETMVTTEEVMRKCEYNSSRSMHEFAYPAPQMFSDENPNACSIM